LNGDWGKANGGGRIAAGLLQVDPGAGFTGADLKVLRG
jgi:hypothetical protein